MYRHEIFFDGPDGIYVAYGTWWTNTQDWEPEMHVVSMWLIPGTQLED